MSLFGSVLLTKHERVVYRCQFFGEWVFEGLVQFTD